MESGSLLSAGPRRRSLARSISGKDESLLALSNNENFRKLTQCWRAAPGIRTPREQSELARQTRPMTRSYLTTLLVANYLQLQTDSALVQHALCCASLTSRFRSRPREPRKPASFIQPSRRVESMDRVAARRSRHGRERRLLDGEETCGRRARGPRPGDRRRAPGSDRSRGS